MDNIFDIRFSFEKKIRDEVITKFSNKQGGDYNVFAYHWQCFAWAAVIGFLRNERRPLTPPIADKPFSLNTMKNNDGEKVAQALICMTIARTGSLDIMKNPDDAINLINEYANGGFYHILKLMENGENSFNDLEKVKQEIFSRNYNESELLHSTPNIEENVISEEKSDKEAEDEVKALNKADASLYGYLEYLEEEADRDRLKKMIDMYYISRFRGDELTDQDVRSVIKAEAS